MASIKKRSIWRGAISLSVVLFLVLLITPFPSDLRGLLFCSLILGWFLAGVFWVVRRFGKTTALVLALVLAAVSLTVGGIGAYAYWEDEPNRRAVSQVRELRAYYVGTTGKLLTGEIDYVYFDQEATDDDIGRFTELDGLQGLKRLVLKGTRINDVTARKLSRLSQLHHLYIQGSRLSEETIDHLFDAMPNCKIEVK